MPKEGQLVVRPYRPSRTRMAVFGICLLLVVFFIGGYVAGSKQFSAAMDAGRKQERELEKSRSEATRLRQSQSNLQLALQVDMATLEQVRKEMTLLQARLVAQESELSRYRNLLGDTGKNGLFVDSFTLQKTSEPGSYTYSLVLRQVDAMIKALDVSVDVRVSGRFDGKEMTYTLADLDPKLEASPITTRFKYFKVVEGVLRLPAGFMPERTTVGVISAGKQPKSVEVVFNWQVDEE